ncbi:MAG: TolC family protein [Gemmatimonadaceae bacterium]|jgi:cobalt-zinc-cadmium efflux system outer membrane protein|nr:TolC family protein [Gemmatimonadaceae bacterium]
MPPRRTSVVPRVPIATLALLTACASTSPRVSQRTVDDLVAARGPHAVAWQADAAADSAIEARVARLLEGELDGDSAVVVALLRNPELRIVLEDVGIARADLVQAGLLRNPLLSLARQPGTTTSFVMQGYGLTLPFLDLLQRPLRRRVAAAQLRATEQRVASEVIALVARTRIAYADARAARELAGLRASIAAATAASAQTAQALHAAGNIPDLDLAAEQALASQAAADLRVARANAVVARQELARLMGRARDDTTWQVPERSPLPDSDSLAFGRMDSLAVMQRLDLAAAALDAEAAGRAAGLTRRFALLPDGQLGVEWADEPDGQFLGPALTIPLPIFDQGRPAIATAQARFRQAVRRHEALRIDALAEVRARRETLLALRERALRLRREVVPLRARVVEESQKQFNAMNLSVFTLLLAKQAEIEAAAQSVEALRDYWVARAELERAVGGTFTPRVAPGDASRSR